MRADNILELFDEIDTSGDGTIDYKEFKVWP
jgi:Ca2+-binding EF-hand superfamily protein